MKNISYLYYSYEKTPLYKYLNLSPHRYISFLIIIYHFTAAATTILNLIADPNFISGTGTSL